MKLLSSFFLTCIVFSQSSTEVYLFDIEYKNSKYSLSNPKNISKNPGYDNQPSFSKDGKLIFFSSTRNNQTDIVRYEIVSGKKKWITKTEGGEYSPVKMNNNNFVSAVRLDPDGKQLLYRYDMRSGSSKALSDDLKIGYYAWVNKKEILCFVLGDPSTLQLVDLIKNNSIIIDRKIGRSIHRIPKTRKMSYVSKSFDRWTINSFDPRTKSIKKIINAIPESEDLTWTPIGIMLMSNGSILFQYDPQSSNGWISLLDFKKFRLKNISRISMSPQGDMIALVAEN